MRTLLLAVLAFSVFWSARATAAGHSARLIYIRDKASLACADEDGVRTAVTKRLGYDPFVAYADMTIVAEVKGRPGGGFVAALRIVQSDGMSAGDRSLASRDCRELVDALALTLSIIVDPVTATRGPQAEPPPEPAPIMPPEPPPPVPAPAPPPAPLPPPPAPRPERVSILVLAAPFVSAGEAPSVAAGGILALSLRTRSLSLGVEARADLPASRSVGAGGIIHSHTVSGWVVPCAHLRWLDGCALVGGGAIFADSTGVGEPGSATGAYFAAGVRVGATLELGTTLVVRPFVDGLIQPFRPVYEVAGAAAYRLSVAGGDAGIAVGARFR